MILNAAPQKLTVGIADMKILQWDGELVTFALGSCIGICLYDPGIKLAALIHIMLPLNMEAGRKNTMKYADTGIRETLRQMEIKGARKSRIVAKIAGGAKMFEVAGNSSLGNNRANGNRQLVLRHNTCIVQVSRLTTIIKITVLEIRNIL